MQGGRGGGDPFFNFGDPFAGFGSFGGFGGRSLISSFFGGRDPFDDPFFRQPFGGMFDSSFFGPSRGPFMDARASGFLENQPPQTSRSRGPIIEELPPQTSRSGGPIIEELHSDDEEEKEDKREKKDNPRKHGRSSNEPYVQEPEDEAEERKSKQMQYGTDFNRVYNAYSQPQARSFTFQSSTVTYGGGNGSYYTNSRTRRTGSDGLTIEETKEADSARAQASHRISRGIHDKGHSFTRKLNPDGRVETMQTLHNLDEGELAGFEEAWKGNAGRHLPHWTAGFNVHDGIGSGSVANNGSASRGRWALPSSEHSHHSGRMIPDIGDGAGTSRSRHGDRIRAEFGGRTGSSWGKSKAAGASDMDHVKRR